MNLIYQYWQGELNDHILFGRDRMKAYAQSIGADYIFEHNPDFLKEYYDISVGEMDHFFSALKPIFYKEYDEKYDTIMFADMDIIPSNHMYDGQYDVFDELGDHEVGIVPELWENHTIHEEWAKKLDAWTETCERMGAQFPKYKGHAMSLNSGVVLYSKRMRQRAIEEKWMDLLSYKSMCCELDAYFVTDQPYIQYMLYKNNADIKFLDQTWNGHLCSELLHDGLKYIVRHLDYRPPATKFNHMRTHGIELISTLDYHKIANSREMQWPQEFRSGRYLTKNLK